MVSDWWLLAGSKMPVNEKPYQAYLVALWRRVAIYIWANVGPGNGLPSDGIKPLSERLIIREVLCHPFEDNIVKDTWTTNHWD